MGRGGREATREHSPTTNFWVTCLQLFDVSSLEKEKKKKRKSSLSVRSGKKRLSVCEQCEESGGGVWLPHSVGCCRLCSSLLCSSSAFIFSFTTLFLYPGDLRWNSLFTEISILQLVHACLFVPRRHFRKDVCSHLQLHRRPPAPGHLQKLRGEGIHQRIWWRNKATVKICEYNLLVFHLQTHCHHHPGHFFASVFPTVHFQANYSLCVCDCLFAYCMILYI